MYAELRPFLRPQRLAGAGATLITLALLAGVIFRSMPPLPATPASEVVSMVVLKPETVPFVLPDIPLPKIGLPIPMAMVNLPEFVAPVPSPALPRVSSVISTDAPPRPSGSEALSGTLAGTGRTNGSGGSILKPPVRRRSADAPFVLKQASRSGLVTSLNFCVNETGSVTDVQLAASSGFDDTDKIAVDWLERQRFKPGTLDGARARMCATYDVRWTYSQALEVEAQEAAKAQARTIRQRSRYPRQFIYWPQGPFPGCDAVKVCRRTIP